MAPARKQGQERGRPHHAWMLLGALLAGLAAPQGLAQQGAPAATGPVTGAAAGQAGQAGLLLTSVGGTVETRGAVPSGGAAPSGLTSAAPPPDDHWTLAQPGQRITAGLRTGTGRALVSLPQGTLTLGAASTIALNRGEPDLLAGRFLLSGQPEDRGSGPRAFVRGTHLAVQGRARLDLSESLQRVAVLSGTVRVSSGLISRTVSEGQQLNLSSGRLSAFTENDPWYDARFEGVGDAQVQATRGTVETGDASAGGNWRASVIGAALPQGARVRTGSGAWAELGFTGGGYLRLQERSRLLVLGIEKTSAGREVLLQLEAGSAWNVVQKKAGGYQLSTPTVTTAVRGTIFRVDADGVVKVFDGAVALPGQGDAVLDVGEQRAVGGAQGALRPDLLDKFNMALDADRARATSVQSLLPPSVQRLTLNVTSNSTSQLSAQLTPVPGPDESSQTGSSPDASTQEGSAQNGGVQNGGAAAALDYALTPAEQPGAGTPSVTPPPSERQFTLDALPPEGRYTLEVRATRYGQSAVRTQSLLIDRTPPQLRVRRVQALGNQFIVTGTVSDNSGEPPLLTAVLGGAQAQLQTQPLAQLQTQGDFVWVLPRPAGATAADIQISAEDPAGNVSRAALP